MITLTYPQLKWLYERSRSHKDVLCDNQGYYIEMSGWSDRFKGVPKISKVYLPVSIDRSKDLQDLTHYQDLLDLQENEREERGFIERKVV